MVDVSSAGIASEFKREKESVCEYVCEEEREKCYSTC